MPEDQIADPKLLGPPGQPPAGVSFGERFTVVRPHAAGKLLGRDTATLASVLITAVDAECVAADASELIARHVAELAGLPGLAPPLHAGREGGWFVLVSPFAHGVPLAERLPPGGLRPAAILALARDLLGALDVAHARGLLHRAISPASVVVNPDGAVRRATLTGFGEAILRDCLPGEAGLPDIRYAAPELAGVLAREIDHRADLYALGLVLHECATGAPVFDAATPGELLRRRLTDPPPSLPDAIPPAVAAAILRLLALEPADRPSSAADVLRALEAADPHPGVPEPASAGTALAAASASVPRGQPRPRAARVFAGRESELGRLQAHLAAACAGRGAALLLEGAAGLGKTRLLDELCRQADAAGVAVLRAGAREQPPRPGNGIDRAIEALSDRAHADPALAARLRAAVDTTAARQICALLPGLRSLLDVPQARAHGRRAPEPARWSGAAALAALLAAAAIPEAPALIVLDDCQWADRATLELIAAWSAAPAVRTPRHAALVVAYRPDAVGPDHPLRALAAPGRLPLPPLEDRAVVELAHAAAAGASDPAARRLVVAAAAGNPARAELALSCLRDAAALPAAVPSPDGLCDWRMELLSDDLRKLLGAGAVLGREFELDVVAAMLGRGDSWAALARADAERRRLVDSIGAEGRRLVFRDDGFRAALVAALPDAERRRLHERARDVLARDGVDTYAAAWHALASGDPPAAVPLALAAARAAAERHAPDVAERYLRAARRDAGELAVQDAVEVAEELAAVQLAQGRADLAEEQLADAARLVQASDRRATINATLARIGAARGDHDAAAAAAQEAIRSRGGRVPRSFAAALVLLLLEIARLRLDRPRRRAVGRRGRDGEPAAAEYALLAGGLAAGGRRRTTRAWATLRALRIAGVAGPSPLLVECQSAYAGLLRDCGLPSAARAAARRAVTLATGVGDDQAVAAALAVDGDLLYAAGRLEAAAARYAAAAQRLGDPAVAQTAILGCGFCDYRLGRSAAARATAAAVRAAAQAADRPELAATALGLWLKAGGRGGAGPLPAHRSAAACEARGLERLHDGDLDRAIDALSRAAAGPGPGELVASARAWLAQASREAGASQIGRAAARAAVRAARAHRSNLPHALRELGLLDAALGHPRRARRRLAASLRAAERQAAREEVARTLLAIGEVGTPLGWPDAPSAGAQGARALAELAGHDDQILTSPPPAAAAAVQPQHPSAQQIDERLASLLVGGRGISAALSTEGVYEAVREAALPLLRAGSAVIVELATLAGERRVSALHPPCDEARARVCRELGLAAATRRRAVSTSDADAGAAIDTAGLGAALCAPVLLGDEVASCVYVERPEPFGAEELRLAEFIAGVAGAALENAEGLARAESVSRSLEQRVEERTAQLADSNRQLDLSLQHLTEAFERERASAAELKHQAFHDPLTDLANRALFIDRVGHALELARRAGHDVAVLFVDLDDFKTVNDSLGHPAGDELLVAVAARLRELLRSADTASRLGGDEFGVVLEGTDRAGAVRAAERILAALERPFRLQAKEVFVHASIGIALRGERDISVDALLRNADVAMYIAKSAGKRGCEVFEQRMHDEIVRRLELKDDLHRGIEARQFVVHYQPIVDIATTRVHGLEALIRWKHPEHGMISPLDFVPLAEETGLIRALGDWVLRTACEAVRSWQMQGPHAGERLTIGVNLSARELHEPGLVDCVAAALRGSGLAAEDLTLEITESVLMRDTAAAIARLRELKALGVRLAIDDFGTGYSSLSYLKHLPVDIVKIAKEFVDDIARGPQEAALAGAIVALSETLHLKTVAEGIESPDQLQALRRLGCDFGQGYLFAKPASAQQTALLLRGERRFPDVAPPAPRLLRAV